MTKKSWKPRWFDADFVNLDSELPAMFENQLSTAFVFACFVSCIYGYGSTICKQHGDREKVADVSLCPVYI